MYFLHPVQRTANNICGCVLRLRIDQELQYATQSGKFQPRFEFIAINNEVGNMSALGDGGIIIFAVVIYIVGGWRLG